jgi:hypothetical protein
MTPRRFATLAAALGGTIVLAGGVIAAVVSLQGIKNIDAAPIEDRSAPPLSVEAEPVDASEATAMGKGGISNADARTAAAEKGTGESGKAEPVEGASPDLSEMLPPKIPEIATASMPAQRKLVVKTSDAAAAVARTVKDKNFDPSTIGDEASRLKNDAVEWGQKLQELEANLKNSPNVDATAKDIDECLGVLRAAAERLAPNSNTRATLRKQEDAIRDLAIRAEVHSNQEIRKTTVHFQQRTAELHAVNRSFEDIRIRLVTEIDRLQELKARLEFNRAAVQNSELLKEGEVSLDNIQALTADAQHLASDLSDFGATLPHSPRLEEPAMRKRVSYPVLAVGQVAGTSNAERQTRGRIFIAEAPIRVPPSGVLVTQPPAPVAVLPSGVLQPTAADPQ